MTTSDNPEHGYVFMVRPDYDNGAVVDRWVDVTPVLTTKTPEAYDDWRAAASSMMGAGDGITGIPKAAEIAHIISGLHLRARMTGQEVYYVRTQDPLSVEDMEELLGANARRGELSLFLARCQWRSTGVAINPGRER